MSIALNVFTPKSGQLGFAEDELKDNKDEIRLKGGICEYKVQTALLQRYLVQPREFLDEIFKKPIHAECKIGIILYIFAQSEKLLGDVGSDQRDLIVQTSMLTNMTEDQKLSYTRQYLRGAIVRRITKLNQIQNQDVKHKLKVKERLTEAHISKLASELIVVASRLDMYNESAYYVESDEDVSKDDLFAVARKFRPLGYEDRSDEIPKNIEAEDITKKSKKAEGKQKKRNAEDITSKSKDKVVDRTEKGSPKTSDSRLQNESGDTCRKRIPPYSYLNLLVPFISGEKKNLRSDKSDLKVVLSKLTAKCLLDIGQGFKSTKYIPVWQKSMEAREMSAEEIDLAMKAVIKIRNQNVLDVLDDIW